MKKQILVDGLYGHGAKVRYRFTITLIRLKRRLLNGHHKVGKSNQVDWSKPVSIPDIKIKDQGQSSSCGGQAMSYLMQVLRDEEYSAKAYYSQGYANGGGMNEGVVRSNINKVGLNLESEVPSYNPDGSPLNETQMIDTSWINPTLVQNAMKRIGYDTVNVAIDIDSIASAIQTYGAVMWLIHGQNNGTWSGSYPLPPSKTNPNEIWGHYMTPAGYQVIHDQQIDSYQSWGISVGDKGIQHFTKTYVDSGYIVDVFAFVKKNQFNGNFGLWSFGSDVYKLQQILIREGVAKFNSPTGFFGPLTFQSVKDYQTKYGIISTGFVGPITRNKLNN